MGADHAEHSVAEDLVCGWLAVLRTAPAMLTDVELPRRVDKVDFVALEDVLNDPACLSDFTTSSPRSRVEKLTMVALWLEELSPHRLPFSLRSRAVRLRFLVWSLPFRARAIGYHGDVLPTRGIPPLDVPAPDLGVLLKADGKVLEYARVARDEWLEHLRYWQDDPWLAARHLLDPAGFERELRLVTHALPPGSPLKRRAGDPGLSLVSRAVTEREARDDRGRVAAEVAETHWLPRGAIAGGVAALYPGDHRARLLLAAAFALLTVAPVLLALRYAEGARWAALIELAGGLVYATVRKPPHDVLLLLRLPAAAAAGALILLSFTPRWWLDAHAWRVGAGLAVASLLYLMLETRLHGATLGRAILRGALIWTVGILYAAVLSITVFGFVAPSVAEQGQCLVGWWTHDPFTPLSCGDRATTQTGAAPAGALVFMTGWSLTIGLAAQILWDDRPVTAPLGRLRNTRGAPR